MLSSKFMRIDYMRYLCSYAFALVFTLFVVGCAERKQPVTTPWGTVVGQQDNSKQKFSMDDILNNGELIVLTLNGPATYYDYHGHGMGLHYLLCEKFAQQLGVALRVEECKDTAEMVKKLRQGDADLIAFPLPKHYKGVIYCGASTDSLQSQWAVSSDNQELADTLNHWFKPQMIAATQREEDFLLSTRSIRRHIYAPMLSVAGGVISHYDRYFQTYAPVARWDWRLMAAQCYQESTFDPHAESWAGARGLMQIMPSTAGHIGLQPDELYDPEKNIAAAAAYIAEIEQKFSDVRSPGELYLYVLASYNGGYHHVRDAMALARKYGYNPYSWADVEPFILKLSQAPYYTDPVVRYGYMRGSETVDYVRRIRQRWAQYCGNTHSSPIMSAPSGVGSFGPMTPQRARHRNRYKL